MKQKAVSNASTVTGRCLCGAVCVDIDYPAFWSWHDHSRASRVAHGTAYATYVGVWRKHFRVTEGEDEIARYEHEPDKTVRSFCRRCGTPLIYERPRSRHMINIPRALFANRTGRQPLYHWAIEEMQDWVYTGERVMPLKKYPGYVRQSARKKQPAQL